jgi:transketolase
MLWTAAAGTRDRPRSCGRGRHCHKQARTALFATGSEVGIGAQAMNALNSGNSRLRLVCMPSTEVFDAQDDAYRESVLPRTVRRRLAVEAGATLSWWRCAGLEGRASGIDRFGGSGKGAPGARTAAFTAEHLAREARELLESAG